MIGRLVVVNRHVFATGSGFPARSLAAVETLPVYCVPAARSVLGTKISAFPYQLRLPLTPAPSLVRFSEKAASAEGLSMEVSKATTIGALGSTSAASSAGRTKLTVGEVPTRTILATEGTPFASIAKSM